MSRFATARCSTCRVDEWSNTELNCRIRSGVTCPCGVACKMTQVDHQSGGQKRLRILLPLSVPRGTKVAPGQAIHRAVLEHKTSTCHSTLSSHHISTHLIHQNATKKGKEGKEGRRRRRLLVRQRHLWRIPHCAPLCSSANVAGPRRRRSSTPSLPLPTMRLRTAAAPVRSMRSTTTRRAAAA